MNRSLAPLEAREGWREIRLRHEAIPKSVTVDPDMGRIDLQSTREAGSIRGTGEPSTAEVRPGTGALRRFMGSRGRSSTANLPGLAALALALLAACAPAEKTVPDRVVLVTIDTLRADRVGCYGGASARTPVLDTMAAEGVRFEFAISPVPLTLPAPASIMTGPTWW